MVERLRAAADDLGKTVALIVHDITIAADYSERIMALRDGRVWAHGAREVLMAPDTLSGIFDTPVRVHTVGGWPLAVHDR